jgi:hypothetical protein
MSFTAHVPDLDLIDVLHLLSARKLTGFTVIVSGGVSGKLVFKRGFVTYASSDTTSRLGYSLVERKIITEADLEKALHLQMSRSDNMPLASCLLKLGLVFPHVLETETKDHIVNVFSDLLTWPSGQVYFEKHEIDDPMTVLKDGLSVDWLLTEASRRQHVSARIDREIFDAWEPSRFTSSTAR